MKKVASDDGEFEELEFVLRTNSGVSVALCKKKKKSEQKVTP